MVVNRIVGAICIVEKAVIMVSWMSPGREGVRR